MNAVDPRTLSSAHCRRLIGTTSLTWDYNDKLTQITYLNSSTNSFTTSDLGVRTTKVDSGGTTTYLRDGANVLADSRADYNAGGITGLISERASSASRWYHGDHLGTTRGITSSSETVTDSLTTDAWGMTVASSGSTASPFGFVGGQGYQTDTDSGLLLLGHRYYDPSIGRFISRDPLGYGGGDVNVYRYCGDDPVNGTDPSGLHYNPWGSAEDAAREQRWREKHIYQPIADWYVDNYPTSLKQLGNNVATNVTNGVIWTTSWAVNWDVLTPSVGGVNPDIPKLPRPNTPNDMPQGPFGRDVMKWGTGYDSAVDRIKTVTADEMKDAGVTREMAENWRDFYLNEFRRNDGNGSAAGRAELMDYVARLLRN